MSFTTPPSPPATDRFRPTTTVAAVFAAAAFFIAFLLATQLAMGVVGLSYLRWLGVNTTNGVVEGVAAMAGVVDDVTLGLWSSGLARGALLIAAFIGGTLALRRARLFPWLRRVALGMSALLIVLAVLVMLLCGFRFALSTALPLDEFVAAAVLPLVFITLSLIPAYIYRLPWLCRVYALPFVALIAIQFALVILAPGPLTMNAKFGGNVALIVLLAAIIGALTYASRLMRHLM